MVTTPRKPRTLEVFVYRNLHLKGVTWSVRQVSTGLVLFHSQNVILKDAKFVVNAAGRDKVRAEGKKNVHAGIRGLLLTDVAESAKLFQELSGDWEEEAKYNPYVNDTFVRTFFDGGPIYKANFVLLSSCDGKSRVTFI